MNFKLKNQRKPDRLHVVGEPITVQVCLSNPFSVPLYLSEVQLVGDVELTEEERAEEERAEGAHRGKAGAELVVRLLTPPCLISVPNHLQAHALDALGPIFFRCDFTFVIDHTARASMHIQTFLQSQKKVWQKLKRNLMVQTQWR